MGSGTGTRDLAPPTQFPPSYLAVRFQLPELELSFSPTSVTALGGYPTTCEHTQHLNTVFHAVAAIVAFTLLDSASYYTHERGEDGLATSEVGGGPLPLYSTGTTPHWSRRGCGSLEFFSSKHANNASDASSRVCSPRARRAGRWFPRAGCTAWPCLRLRSSSSRRALRAKRRVSCPS